MNRAMLLLLLFASFFAVHSPAHAQFYHSNTNFLPYVGGGYYDYRDINNQFKTYHSMEGVQIVPVLGIQTAYRFEKFVLSGAIEGTYRNLQKGATFNAQQLSLKFEIPILENAQRAAFPYVGFSFQNLTIHTKFDYAIRCPDCFFQMDHTYSALNAFVLFGISYQFTVPSRNFYLSHVGLELDLGGVYPVQGKYWLIDGQAITDNAYAPEATYRIFLAVHLFYKI
ncbi:MAG: hypothetical protein GXO76_02085 [Calditrichaeota bacterium]|nr:hypothetical protein [Calditrichota bacterium]